MKEPRKKRKDASTDALVRTCAWCGNHTAADQNVTGFGAKARSGVDLSRHHGRFIAIDLPTAQKKVLAAVPAPDSPAARDGHDFYFMLCSDSCANDLKDALREESRLGKSLVRFTGGE